MLFSVARRCTPGRSLCVTGCWPPEEASSSSGVASSLGGEPPIFVMICRTGGTSQISTECDRSSAIAAEGLPERLWF